MIDTLNNKAPGLGEEKLSQLFSSPSTHNRTITRSKSLSYKWKTGDCRYVMNLCLLLCGDVQVHPGPNTPQLPCTVCSRGIRSNSKAVSCDGCDEWTHLKCCNQHSMEIPIKFIINAAGKIKN